MAGIPSQVARGSLWKESEWKTVSALPVVAVEWRFTNGSRVLRMRTYRQKAERGLRIDLSMQVEKGAARSANRQPFVDEGPGVSLLRRSPHE